MAERRPDRVLGPAHDDFWAWCDKGELRLQRCAHCARLAWPVVQTCDHCGTAALEWERLSGAGRIVSWCTFEHDYYKGMLSIPYDTILVELDEGALFISNPVDFGRRQIEAGMPVTLRFLACEDSAGAYRLPVFAKAE